MPAGFTSARFVGRESAFARLAPALEAATAGVSTTVLLEGTGGVGVSRFLTEATSRLTALAEPFTVLRGRSVPAGTDEPYAPILQALRPTLAALSDDELVALLGPGVEDHLRLMPELHVRLSPAGAVPAQPSVTSAERRQARLLEGVLGVLGRLGERQPVMLVLEDLHHADAGTRAFATFLTQVQRPHRVCFVASYQPDEVTRSHPLSADVVAMTDARRPAERRPHRAARAQRARGPHPGDRRANGPPDRRSSSLPSGAAAFRSSSRSSSLPGASCRGRCSPAASTTSSIARLALRSPECRRVLRLLAPAGRPLTIPELADVAAAYELTAEGRLPPRSSSLPRRGEGPIDADLTAGLAEGVEHGLIEIEQTGVDFRHELVGRAVVAGPAAGPAASPPSRPRRRPRRASDGRGLALARGPRNRRGPRRGGRGGRSSGGGPRPGRRARRARARPVVGRSERARDRPDRRRTSPMRRRGSDPGAAPDPRRRGRLRGRSPGPGHGVRRDRHEHARRAARSDGPRPAPRAARALPAGGRRQRRGRRRRSNAPSPSCPTNPPSSGRPSSPRSPRSRCSRAPSPRPSGWRARPSGSRRRAAPDGRGRSLPTPRRPSACRSAGATIRRRVSLCCERPGPWPRRPPTTTSCSGSTPTSRRSSTSSAGARRP